MRGPGAHPRWEVWGGEPLPNPACPQSKSMRVQGHIPGGRYGGRTPTKSRMSSIQKHAGSGGTSPVGGMGGEPLPNPACPQSKSMRGPGAHPRWEVWGENPYQIPHVLNPKACGVQGHTPGGGYGGRTPTKKNRF